MDKKHMELLKKEVQGKILKVERVTGLDYESEFLGGVFRTHIQGTDVLRDGIEKGTFYRVDSENEILTGTETLTIIYKVKEINFSDFDKETTFDCNISDATFDSRWRRGGKDYCTQNNEDCGTCSLSNYGRDCQNNKIEGDGENE